MEPAFDVDMRNRLGESRRATNGRADYIYCEVDGRQVDNCIQLEVDGNPEHNST